MGVGELRGKGRAVKKILTLDSLKGLNSGLPAAAWQKELEHITRDCVDRPGDPSPRTLTMTLVIVPKADNAGTCDAVEAEIEIKAKVPPRRSRKYEMGVNAKGVVTFNDESPESIRQGTLDEVEPPSDKRRARLD